VEAGDISEEEKEDVVVEEDDNEDSGAESAVGGRCWASKLRPWTAKMDG